MTQLLAIAELAFLVGFITCLLYWRLWSELTRRAIQLARDESRRASRMGVSGREVRLVAHNGVSHYAVMPSTSLGLFEVPLIDPGVYRLEIAEGEEWYAVTGSYEISGGAKVGAFVDWIMGPLS